MSEQPKSSWTYHPLSGNELLKWIFADAWKKLSEDGQFGAHLTYHNPSYRVKLEVQAFDASSKGITNGAFTETTGAIETSSEPVEELAKKSVRFMMDLGSEEPMKEPDRAREVIDEGRYKTVMQDGVLIDKKVKKSDNKETK